MPEDRNSEQETRSSRKSDHVHEQRARGGQVILDWRALLVIALLILVLSARWWLPPLVDVDFEAVWADKNYKLSIKPDELSRSRSRPVAYRVAVANLSHTVSDDEVKRVTAVLQTQVHRDLAPAWGVDADLTFVPSGTLPSGDSWLLQILDESDNAGALAYHDVTTSGLPLAKVFAGTAKETGAKWTISASHELLELLVDPRTNLTAVRTLGNKKLRFYAYEICPPVQGEDYAYMIDGVAVSDFVFPEWFNDQPKPNITQFDYGKHLTQPFQILKGGDAAVYEENEARIIFQ